MKMLWRPSSKIIPLKQTIKRKMVAYFLNIFCCRSKQWKQWINHQNPDGNYLVVISSFICKSIVMKKILKEFESKADLRVLKCEFLSFFLSFPKTKMNIISKNW